MLGCVALVCLGALAGCGSAATPTATPAAPSPPASTSPDSTSPDAALPDGEGGAIAIEAGTFDVGGRRMYLQCAGAGSPTVVLIGGLRAGADYWDQPGQAQPTVFQQLAKHSRVCSYDRPGTVWGESQFSRSDAVPQPSSEDSAAVDLHALLVEAGESGPYVLAAHSYGGFIARVFAGAHPEEVSGLVLIDALSEGFADALSPQDYAAWQRTQEVPAEDLAAYPAIERLDLDAVMGQIRAVPGLPPIPVIVVSADRLYGPLWGQMIDAGSLPPGTPADLGYAIDHAQRASQAYQAQLAPDAVHITQTHSGHDIAVENPGLVLEAIKMAGSG